MIQDPIAHAKEEEAAGRRPFIVVQEFRIDYKPQADGSQKPIEMVEWRKRGVQNASTTVEYVARAMKDPEIWPVIEPYYKNWKRGEEAPIIGTPLAAWPGATPSLVKALGAVEIRSVEDLARLEDSAIMKLSIPNLRDKQKQARSYLEAQVSTAAVANENAKLKETVEVQAGQIAELRAAVEALMAKDDDEGAPKRGPGRPRKVQEAA